MQRAALWSALWLGLAAAFAAWIAITRGADAGVVLVAAKLATAQFFHVPPLVSLGAIALIVTAAVVASLLFPAARRDPQRNASTWTPFASFVPEPPAARNA